MTLVSKKIYSKKHTTMRVFRLLSVLAFCMCVFNSSYGHIKGKMGGKATNSSAATNANKTSAGACTPATAQTDLSINNVRTTILNGGDMWWDLQNNPRYEIPKGSNRHSIFAGALWIGGIDGGGQLKVAAMNYRQSGNDYWPGPLNMSDATISDERCTKYDHHYKMTRSAAAKVADGAFGSLLDEDVYGNNEKLMVNGWPGSGDASFGEDNFLAPFKDVGGDGQYDVGVDYPYYYKSTPGAAPNCKGNAYLYGDQTLWWVFNDKGNIHSETGAVAIGLEIRAQAFAFNTNDDINNMTFYQYEIINRSSYGLGQTYFGQWVDPDLGNYADDYVGCDVSRGLGYVYNGDQEDEGTSGYGSNPPALGVDFFQGPLADLNDGKDNDRDGQIDEPGEEIIMSKFVYYNNNGSPTGEPSTGNQFYGYLKGFWKDGTQMEFGGNGWAPSGSTNGIKCDFMFPGDSDPQGLGTGGVHQSGPDWTEAEARNTPYDRRFIQSAGPFTLAPGARNFITTGVVWARATQGGPQESIKLMKLADDKAQALFNNCFKVLDGPDAPDLTIQELSKELIIMISNKATSNNYKEEYFEVDPTIATPSGLTFRFDSIFRFQGYKLYQLKTQSTTAADLENADLARLVSQCDVKDGVSKIVNYLFDKNVNASVPKEMVNGSDNGIFHSIRITDDLFASGNAKLVNQKSYYFMVVAYGYNNFKPYQQDLAPDSLSGTSASLADYTGQKIPYKEGRLNVKTYTAIPHIPSPESGGTKMNAQYGDGPKITKVEGRGNGGRNLDLTEETVNAIMASTIYKVDQPQYQSKKGPIEVKVIDPLNIPNAEFEVKFVGSLVSPSSTLISNTSKWTIKNLTDGAVINSEVSIKNNYEQIIPEWGIAVNIVQIVEPGTKLPVEPGLGPNQLVKNGFIEGTIEYADNTKQWLSGVPDIDGGIFPLNWIRSGTDATTDYTGKDNNQDYEKILGGTWAPYCLTAAKVNLNTPVVGAPGWGIDGSFTGLLLDKLASVDVVFTNDKTKWSRCPVIEMADESVLSEGNAKNHDIRKHASVDKDGKPDGTGTGMGWFPGYCINVETGERLNIAFGEDSWLVGENGRDMIWNPTQNLFSPPANWQLGGKHCIFIFGNNNRNNAGQLGISVYDEGARLRERLDGDAPGMLDYIRRSAWSDCIWVGYPLVAANEKLLSNDVKVRLRVQKPYYAELAPGWFASAPENANMPMYKFDTKDLYTVKNNADAAKKALDLINVVPNPYYAYSQYEQNQIDSRVKITNLPFKCEIVIYNLNGTLIRKYKKDDELTFVDWDLKNTNGIPIASGLYLVHVKVDGVGEKIVKFMGMMRPIDLDNF